MTYKCTKYNKILVGSKKTCDSAVCGIGYKNKCNYRIWQEGVLKEGGQRARGIRRTIFPKGAYGPGFFYVLGDDGNYHHFKTSSDYTQSREGISVENDAEIPFIPVLTPEEMADLKKHRWKYNNLLEQKLADNLAKKS